MADAMLTTDTPFSVCKTAADYSHEIEQSFEDICAALNAAIMGHGDQEGATSNDAEQSAAPSVAVLQHASDRFNRLCDEFHQLLLATADKLLLTEGNDGTHGTDENRGDLSDMAVQAHLDRTAAMQQTLRDTAAQVLQLHA